MAKIGYSIFIIILGILSIIYDEKLTDIPVVVIVVAGVFAIIYGLLNIFISISRNKNVLGEKEHYKTTTKNNLDYYEKLVEMILFSSFFCILIIIFVFLVISNEPHLLWTFYVLICIAIATIRACKNFIDCKTK